MEGLIVKLLKDLYFVYTEYGVIEAKARGVFRERNINPLVGDRVTIKINEDGSGYIEEVHPRSNELKRPEVANIDLVLNIHSIKSPKLNTYNLDKGLIMAEYYGIESIVVFSKADLITKEEFEKFKKIYTLAGYLVYKISMTDKDDIEDIREIIEGKTSVVSGPSGTGKSTFLNRLNPDLNLETSAVSNKTQRGRHTTRHTELMVINDHSFILDTPGFSSINLDFIEDEKLLDTYMPDLMKYKNLCKFNDCMHINEPGCKVKEEIGIGISKSRYDNYLLFMEEIKKFRRY